MDLRITKTRSAITNAFLEIRSGKPLEKITIKELCEKALINKSTFYAHFRDIYDLSEYLENEVVLSVIKNLPAPDQLFKDPAHYTHELFLGYIATDSLIQILFSGTRQGELVRKIEWHIKDTIFTPHPELRCDTTFCILLSYCIYGGYYAYTQNREHPVTDVVACIAEITRHCLQILSSEYQRINPE